MEQGKYIIEKIPGEVNPADALTKPLDSSTLEKLLRTIGLRFRTSDTG